MILKRTLRPFGSSARSFFTATECMYSFRTIQQSVCTLSGQYNRVYVLFPDSTTECMYSFRTVQQSVCTLSGQYNRVYVLFPDSTTECMYSFRTIQQSVCTLSGQYNRVYVLFPDNTTECMYSFWTIGIKLCHRKDTIINAFLFILMCWMIHVWVWFLTGNRTHLWPSSLPKSGFMGLLQAGLQVLKLYNF